MATGLGVNEIQALRKLKSTGYIDSYADGLRRAISEWLKKPTQQEALRSREQTTIKEYIKSVNIHE